ncbi:hypothetical protein RKD44_001059 [Streptomyces collinus]
MAPGAGEVVSGGGPRGTLLGDQRVEHRGGPVDHRRVREGARQDDDAGALGEGVDEFGRRPGVVTQLTGVVHGDVPLHGGGPRVGGRVGRLLDELAEGGEIAVARGQVGAVGGYGRCGHRRPFADRGDAVLSFLS